MTVLGSAPVAASPSILDEDAYPTPALPAIGECLVQTIVRGRIAPSSSVAVDEKDPAGDPAIIDPVVCCGFRERTAATAPSARPSAKSGPAHIQSPNRRLRQTLRLRSMDPESRRIPERTSHITPAPRPASLRQPQRIKILFARLKDLRRVATSTDRWPTAFSPTIALVTTVFFRS